MLLECDRPQLLMVDVRERLLPAMSDPTLVMKNCGRLLEAARTLAVPVVVSEQYPVGLGRTVPDLANVAPAMRCMRRWSSPALPMGLCAPHLSDAGRQTVIFGIEAHVDGGHDVMIVVDAISSRMVDSKEIRLQDTGVRLATTEMVLFEWLRRAGTPEFKTISRLIR
jgi:hypothetical protein